MTTNTTPRTLNKLAVEINKNLVKAGTAFFAIAKCLNEAQDRIKQDNLKVDAADRTTIVKWANDEFSFGKAWTYKAIKMANTFSDEEAEDAFEFCSARVLGELASMKFEKIEEVKQIAKETKEAVEEAKEAGADEQEVEEIKQEASEEIKEVYQEAQDEKKAEKEAKLKTDTPEAESADVASDFDAGVPWDTNDKEDSKEDNKGDLAQLNKLVAEQAAMLKKQMQTIADLHASKKAADDLSAENKRLRAELEAAQALAKKAPALVQFNSESPASILGLSEEQAQVKRTVNQAARMLASVYTSEHSAEEFNIIKVAKTELLANIKALETA